MRLRPTRRHLVLALEGLAWGTLLVLVSAMLALRYWALPNIERWSPQIVDAISRGVGQKVTVGSIEADWPGLRPRIELSDVRLHDREGREALVLPTVTAVVSWRSLLFLDLRMRSFTIEAPRLAVRRDAAGAMYVAGMKLSQEKGDGRLTDWILGQNEIVIRDAEIEWTDELRAAPPLALKSLEFRLHNDGDVHEFGLSAKPPAHLGSGIDLRASLVGSTVAQPSAWNGRVFAELGSTDLAGWRQWVDYPLDVRKGQGALRIWATLGDGRLTRATADVALTDVVARLGRDLPVLEITSVRGRVQGRETPNGYEFGARNLALATPKGPEMQSTSFVARIEGPTPRRAGVQIDENWKPNRGSVSANQIELAPLARLADFLPFPADLRQVLAELAPAGVVQDAKFDWTGELTGTPSFSAKARFTGLGIHPWRRLPGFAGLSGSLEATDQKGALRLASQKAEVDLPRIFPEPRIALEALSGQVDWERHGEQGVAVRIANLAFANQHAAGTAFGSYAFTGEGPGTIDLSANLSRAEGRFTAKYLPLSTIMGERTREWLASAVQEGQSSDVRLRLKGDLRDFPFTGGQKGLFQVTAKITGAKLEYASGWPLMEAIDGDLLFENEKMEIVGRSARILGARLSNVRAQLPSLLGQDKVLHLQGAAEGPTQEFLKYIAQSPVRRHIHGVTDPMSATGAGRLSMKLDIPLGDTARTKLSGEFRFSGNTLRMDGRMPPIERAAGTVAFTESSLSIRDGSGQLFGGPVAIGGGTQKEGGVAVVARGTFTTEGIRPVFDHPWRRYASGTAPYTATVTSQAGVWQIAFESSLAGIAVTLPPPLEKAAAAQMPLRVEITPGESGARERISVSLARQVQAEFLRSREGDEMRLQRAAVALNPSPGEPMRLPERRGLLLYGTLASLDLDRWRPILAAGEGGGAGATSFELRLGSLDAFGKRLRTVAMKGGADSGGWSANVNSAELAGDLAYRSEGNGRLTARLAYFTLPDDVPGAKPAASATSTRDFPAVDLVAESFTFRGSKLGRVEIAADHDGPNWRIDRISMLNPDSSMSAKGVWQTGSVSRTSLAFTFDASDVGKFLERIGKHDHVKAGRGKLSGSLAWNGDPVTLDYPTLSGELALAMEDGQFLEIEPGIGKLVSLMSLQMLPRRVALDFRDVFSKGFQFDKIGASFAVRQGVMTTRDFRMNGPAADVEMSGDIDLARETQKLHVKVIPQLGDTASTVVGLVNPIAGVATLIAGRLMKNPLGQVFAFQYSITGSWADPKVEKAGGPPPASPVAQEAPGAAPAPPAEPSKPN